LRSRSPCGFGKRYFSLASIQAYSVQITLNKECTRIGSLDTYHSKTYEDKEEDPPPLLDELLTQELNSYNPYRCNCYYRSRSKRILNKNKTLKRCQCSSKCFSFRRSGIHPPFIYINSINQ
jgi:hypothetical protein